MDNEVIAVNEANPEEILEEMPDAPPLEGMEIQTLVSSGSVVQFCEYYPLRIYPAFVTWVDPSVDGRVNLVVFNDTTKKLDWLNAVEYDSSEKPKKRTWRF